MGVAGTPDGHGEDARWAWRGRPVGMAGTPDGRGRVERMGVLFFQIEIEIEIGIAIGIAIEIGIEIAIDGAKRRYRRKKSIAGRLAKIGKGGINFAR